MADRVRSTLRLVQRTPCFFTRAETFTLGALEVQGGLGWTISWVIRKPTSEGRSACKRYMDELPARSHADTRTVPQSWKES